MRTYSFLPFILLFALVPLTAGCVDTTCDGKVIEVNMNYSVDANGDSVAYDCGEEVANGTWDFSGCCPEGWDFLAVSSDNNAATILCEEDCGLGSTASVEHFTDVAFLVHNVTTAALDAVEDLNAGP